jgi:hypothetical protein
MRRKGKGASKTYGEKQKGIPWIYAKISQWFRQVNSKTSNRQKG